MNWAGAFRRQAERALVRLSPGARSARLGGRPTCTADHDREQPMNRLFSWLPRSAKRPAGPNAARTSRARRTRPALRLETLEDRAVPAALSVADVTVREGPTSLGVLDPSGAASVGISGIRGIVLDSTPGHPHSGDLFVTGWLSHSV